MQYEFEQDKTFLVVIYLLVLFVGLALLFWSFYKFRQTEELLSVGKYARATVAELNEEDSGDGTTFRPIFRYKNEVTGEMVEFQYEISSNPIVWKRGEEVSIVYDPANPTYAKVVSFWSLYRLVYNTSNDCYSNDIIEHWIFCFSSSILILISDAVAKS
ncbi:MAG: DUF3592 domain-containing protein [Bacteroidetes bacterium]|nr:DUF3592 domain-containing protein [Bacteroidota bacterium]